MYKLNWKVLILMGVIILTECDALGVNCSDTSFWCNDGTCVDARLKCNGVIDCPDASDEDFVTCRTIVCKEGEFQCVYGACVKGSATCNGVQDCADNSDELLAQCRHEVSRFDCVTGLIGTVIINPYLGFKKIKECDRKEDSCKNGQIPEGAWMRCNGNIDCTDRSDETLETCASNKCIDSSSWFRCQYGACIRQSGMCNGINECADGSDELEQMCREFNNDKVKCTLPAYPKNDFYSVVDRLNASPGQLVKSAHLNYSCHIGYKLVGNPLKFCLKGRWSEGEPPKCLSQCQLNKHHSVEYVCLPKDSNDGGKECREKVEDGTSVRPQCRSPNYYFSGVLVNMHCVDGVWDHVVICSAQCGLVTAEGDPLVIGGRRAKHGELPWHAGIYSKTYNPYKQICGGSLISATLIVSAAHCFWVGSSLLPTSEFAISLGNIYRSWNDSHDGDAQHSDVLEIKTPSRFRGAAGFFQEDIALLVLATRIKFVAHVQPVCVDFDRRFERRQLHIGSEGRVAGWGFTAEDDGKQALSLQVVDLPVVEIETCITGSPLSFERYITSDKFCAGYNNGTGRTVCKGDSGGGLVFMARERGAARFFLRGVASLAPTSNHFCHSNVFATFTQVSRHEELIEEYLSN